MQDILRDYQQEAIRLLFNSWKQGSKKPLLSLPTGAGKTTVASYLIHRMNKAGRKALFVAHRRELVEQAHHRLACHGIDAGLIMPGYHPNGHLAIVGSVQSIIRRPPTDVDLIIIDEAHHILSPSFQRVLEGHVGDTKRIVGLTATPYRLDGKPLGRVFDDYISPVDIDQLVAQKYLVPLRYYAAATEKELTEGVKKIGGDYAANTMFERMNKKWLYDGAVEKYQKFSGGKALVFCCNVEHSQKTAEAFAAKGIRAQHLDGETPLPERIKIVKDFRQGRLDVLTNCNLFTEGFDLPDINAVVLNRATASKCLYTQMVGRAMRPAPGKEYGIVIDMGNNVKSHGFVEDLQEHDIFREPKPGDGVAPTKDCPKCFAMVHASAARCKYCGYVFPVTEMKLSEAEFVEVRREPTPLHLRKKWSQMTKAELEEYAEFRGYKPGWVTVQLKLRKSRPKTNSLVKP